MELDLKFSYKVDVTDYDKMVKKNFKNVDILKGIFNELLEVVDSGEEEKEKASLMCKLVDDKGKTIQTRYLSKENWNI